MSARKTLRQQAQKQWLQDSSVIEHLARTFPVSGRTRWRENLDANGAEFIYKQLGKRWTDANGGLPQF